MKNLKFTEENVLHVLDEAGMLNPYMMMRKFGVKFAICQEKIDELTERGIIKQEGRQWVKVKAKSKKATSKNLS